MNNALGLSPVVTRLLDKHRGVRLNGVWYWAPEFADKRLGRRKLTVFPDLLNEDRCHVEIDGKWVCCKATPAGGQRPRAL